jgi:hypothetical protein
MKKLMLFLAAFAVCNQVSAQKSKKKSKANMEESVKVNQEPVETSEERMAKVAAMESRMIGPMHHLLVQWSGHWREEMKVWTNSKADPAIYLLEREARIVGEGKFLTINTRGQLGHEPYEAQSVIGFDNGKQKFVKTWFDNLGTSILVLEGTYNEKENLIDFEGSTINPATRKPVRIHQIMRLTDPNSQLLEVYSEKKDGTEFKSMEIKSTRG